ncbi:TOG array regulator of axonemal microtubules protein 1 isoform X4 [Crotalus tigris]|uniref:TOG array regulator of axonemal microtubules protein 1 isoform X4 n=1 Tax=Crotalus tigris TaxID=88082 RepID=UPI00192F6C41|nr:TOG array regulator of axonemal microtubules protein 1 isoform X4 [Crotalus tigris]
MAREEEQEGGASGGGGGGGGAGGRGAREQWEALDASFLAGRVPSPTQPGATLRFGLVPSELHARLLDQQDYRGRVGAMEQLKRVLGEAPGAALACLPPPNLLGLLSLLRALLDDSNFKVALGALEGLRLLAVRLGPAAGSRSRLEPLVAAAAKVLGDAKLAIRQEYHQLFLGLMRAAGPQPVLDLLLRPEHLQHRNSRVREVVLAISIAALLTFPSEDFELPKLVAALAPALADSKRRVRHAALEAFAVLASALGPGRTSLIFKAVDVVELQDNCEGVMSAVQARLARKTLPKLTDQWFVEYAVPLPSSANGRGFHLPHGADTDWLLEGNRIQSAHSYSGETAGSFTPFADHAVCPRRVLSAGKGKLPWESERPGNQTCFAKGSEPCLTSNDFLYSPKLRASQGVMASHQPHISGKSNLLGFSHSCGKSGSVDSDLQFLGLSSSWQDKEVKPQDTPPIQLKPAFVRTPASRRGLSGTKPVPPIPRGVSPLPDKIEISSMGRKNGELEDMWLNERDKKLAIDLSELNISERELDEEEMHSSLRSLRNSAAKKRAKLNGSTSDLESPDSVLKLDLTSESPSCLSSPSTSSYSESGVYSLESVTSPLSTAPQGLRTISDIFYLPGSNSRPTKLSPARNRNSIIVEQNPSAGTRFHEKATSYVSVSSQHLSCGNGSGDYEDDKQKVLSPASLKGQSKEYQMHCKSTKGFTGPSSSLHQLNSLEYISPSALSEDSVVIVGKGMFESPSLLPTYGQSIIFSMENGDAPSFKPKMESLSGIYGRAVQQQNSAPCIDVENERDMKVALSKSAREKMRQKKREEKEHQQIRDPGKKESNPWELLKISESEKMATESRNIAFSPLLKRTSSIKKAQPLILIDSVAGEDSPDPQMPFKDQTSVTHSSEIMEPSDLRPFPKPEVALLEALQYVADNDWEKKIEGLNSIRCLSAYHSDALTAKLHETSLAVVQEVKNLRSVVSRAAVVCLGDLFNYLKKSMDQELDNTVKVLLHKAGESNTFIREDVDKALKAMVNNVTPARALSSLINGGQSHLNIAVRRCTAQHLSDVVEHMGPGRILSGIKDITDKILSAVAKFVQDGSQETRYYGRKMLFTLMTHTDFDKMLEKHVLPKDLPYVKETVSNLRQKGLGEMPIVTPSAKGRRSHTGNIDNSRSNMSRKVLSASDREIREIRDMSRKLVPRNALENAEYVKFITTLLNAKDFRDRINGIKQLLEDTENNQDLVVANIVKIFDAFKSRLHDSNSKVNQVALETMHQLIPLLKEKLSPVINMLIPALVDNNLNSKNPGIYAAATNVIQALCQHLDNYLLLQPFCTKAQFLNGKAKQDITEKLAELVVELYPRKPHAVEQKVLVVLWHLLGNMTNSGSLPGAGGNIRAATAKLSKALFAQMGQNLLIQAASQPPHIKRTLEEIFDQTT